MKSRDLTQNQLTWQNCLKNICGNNNSTHIWSHTICSSLHVRTFLVFKFKSEILTYVYIFNHFTHEEKVMWVQGHTAWSERRQDLNQTVALSPWICKRFFLIWTRNMCYEDHIHDQRLLNLVTCSTQFHYVKIKHVLFLSPLTHSRTTSLYSLKIQKFLYSHCLS